MHARTTLTATLALLMTASAPGPGSAQQPELLQHRPDVMGRTAAVSAGHPLAAQAGADVLKRGGNAVDAAITMAAVLSVVRPHMNGVGGDAFMLIRDAETGRTEALNGSGRAGARATLDEFGRRGLDRIPSTGILSVSVPGAVRAWADALERHGTITLAEALAPAIRFAEEGFPVSRELAADIGGSRRSIQRDPEMARTFLPGGEPPRAGSLLKMPDLARTLRAIAADGPAAFYTGDVARRIVSFMEQEDGLLTAPDLAGHTSTWTEPVWTTYHGYRVAAFPPNTQGIALLMQLNMAEQVDLKSLGHNSAEYIDRMVGMKRLAFRERDRWITDPAFADIPVDRLISKEFARQLLAESATDPGGRPRGDGRAGGPSAADGEKASGLAPRDGSGDTVYLCVVDAAGNAVSMIESLFAAFGSARMVPNTGVLLHNRGSLFELDPEHLNAVAPGKRPYHTLTPHLAEREDGSLFMVFGTPGGDGQTQTHAQVLNNLLLFGMRPQVAVEAPRWRSYGGARLSLEPGIADAVVQALAALGHEPRVGEPLTTEFGGAQLIMIDAENGVRIAAADPRREAYAIAW